MYLLGVYELNYTIFTDTNIERHFLMFRCKENHPLHKILAFLSFRMPKIAYLNANKRKIMLNNKNEIEIKPQ